MSSHATSLPPQTPTRALLSRLRRRSSLMPSSDTINPHDSPGFATMDDGTHDDEEDFRRLEQQVEHLLLESKDKDREVERLRAQLQQQNSKTKGGAAAPARGKAGQGVAGNTTQIDSSGLTQEAARKLEGEFEAQEMILKGLQRDNESKTIEVEQLRRQMRTMSDFLTRQCGHDWEDVVFGGNGGASSGQASTLPADLDEDPLSIGTDSVGKHPSHIAQTLRGQSANLPKMASTPNARQTSPLKRMAFLHKDNGSSTDDDDDETSFSSAAAATPSTMFQPKKDVKADDSFEAYILESKSSIKPKKPDASMSAKKSTDGVSAMGKENDAALLAQLEATRMLLQGFARRNARRSQELRELEEKARNEMAMGREFLTDGASRVVAGEAP